MSSRDEILHRVRRPSAAPIDPPAAFTQGIRFTDPVSQFDQVLTAVGGKCEQVASLADAARIVKEIASDIDGRKVFSAVAGVERANFDVSGIIDPHDVEDVDLAIIPGLLAVAENAAVWVTASTPVERALYFLTQHLALIVPREQVVSNLHDAYTRIDIQATPFGTWISGPSKTADIEQSLVMGAHGPRTLTVILVDDMSC